MPINISNTLINQSIKRSMKDILMYEVLFITMALLIFSGFKASSAQNFQIEIDAGTFDRSHTPVSFYFPEEVDEGVYSMQSEDGDELLLQVDEQNRGWFILDDLEAGERVVYSLDVSLKKSNSGHLNLNHNIDETTILLQSGENSVLNYFHGENDLPDGLDERYKRGGYIHPVFSPNGVILTNHLNVDLHPHHSGIWSAWTNTEFEGRTPDFWNVHQNTGRVDQVGGLQNSWQGPVFGGFKAQHQFIDLSAPGEPEIALNEKWDVKVYHSAKDFHFFDLIVTQTVNTSKPLILPEYRYGGVGFRGHKEWDDPNNITFLTAEGLGRDGHATRTRWTHIGGHVEGELAGIAIMGHPSNFRHPQPVRIHPDEPFFNFAPQQLGEMRIDPGAPYEVRYRYVTYDGEPDPDKLNRLWNDFAYTPGVTVSLKN